jgi:outer membrane protein assembly factor BamD
MKIKSIILSLSLAAVMLLTGCSKKKANDEVVIPAGELYQNGIRLLQDHKYSKAADEFEKIFFQHPGNIITPQAELMQAYSLYLAADYDIAYDVLDVFIKLHPRHEDIAYAYYLKAMANYAQISSVKLDQSRTKLAKADFEMLINRFPGSKYAVDGALKLDLIDDHLAGKEMLVGRYYLKKRNPIAAIQRFQTVINGYATTMHTQEALYRMVESNVMLGLFDEAQKYAAVLAHNFPESSWRKKADGLLNK